MLHNWTINFVVHKKVKMPLAALAWHSKWPIKPSELLWQACNPKRMYYFTLHTQPDIDGRT